MRNLFFFFTFILTSSSFACDEAMKAFQSECKAQDHYQSLINDFNKYSIFPTDLKGFKIPKAIGNSSYNAKKDDLLNRTASSLLQHQQWAIWNNGQNFIKNLSLISLETSDILKLHKALFSTSVLSDSEADLGKLRASGGLTDPKLTFSCDDQLLNDKLYDILSHYDLKNYEGAPLLRIDNVQACDDRNFSSANVYFLKSSGIPHEINRWVLDFSDMLSLYEKVESTNKIAPFNYLADMRRWFLALRPFNRGNEEVIDTLIDYATKRLHLPPLPSNDYNLAIFLSVSENQEQYTNKINDSLSFFENCLQETKLKTPSPECSAFK